MDSKKTRLITFGLLFILALSIGLYPALGQGSDRNLLTTGFYPVSIAITDLDATLGADLVVVTGTPSDLFAQNFGQKGKKGGSVTVFSGLGDGSFAPIAETRLGRELPYIAADEGGFRYRILDYPVIYPNIHQPYRLSSVVADFDGDGVKDLLVLYHDYPYILWLTGLHMDKVKFLNWGRFEQSMNLDDLKFESDATSMAAADFDRDGRPDLVITREGSESENTLLIYHNEGDGNFSESAGWPIAKKGAYPYFVTTDDVDNDGNEDIIVARGGYLATDVLVIKGNGDGTFQFNQRAEFFVGHELKCVRVITGDFNNDGNDDLIVAGAEQLIFLAGTGQESSLLQAKKVIDFWRAPDDLDSPIGMVANDFNHDHNLDFAVADPTNDCVRIYYGNGNGGFTERKRLLVGQGWKPDVLATYDVNGDMHPDLLVGGRAKAAICVLLGEQGDGFRKVQWPRVGNGVTSITAGDFNHDANVDLAVSHLLPVVPGIHFSSTMKTARIGGEKYSAGDTLYYSALDKDKSEIELFLGPFLHNSAGSPMVVKIPLNAEQVFPRNILAQDLNGDGRDDLVLAPYGVNYIFVNLSLASTKTQASVQFSGWHKYYVGWYPIALLAGDWNGDGCTDLAVVNFRSNNISILLNQGDGSFRELAQRLQMERKPIAATVGDYNSDGKLDLAVTYKHSPNISLLFGKGDGTFESQRSYNTGLTNGELLSTGNFDGRNGPDLVLGTVSGDMLILLNKGDGTFKVGSKYSTNADLHSLVTVDYDNDGNIDILTASLSNGARLWRGGGDGTFTEGAPITTAYNIIGDSADVVHPSSMVVRDNLVGIATEFPSGKAVMVNALEAGKVRFPEDIFICSSTPPPLPPPTTSPQVLDITTGDFNRDSADDLAYLVRYKNGDSALITRLAPGTTQTSNLTGEYGDGSSIKAVDLDGDGLEDIIIANRLLNTLTPLWGKGDGTFLQGKQEATVVAPSIIAAGKAKGWVAAVAGSSSIDILTPSKDTPRSLDHMTLNIGDNIAAISSADLNGDQYTDIIVATTFSQQILIFSGLDLAKNKTSPVFSLHLDAQPSALCVFRADDHWSIAITLMNANKVQFLQGGGQGGFTFKLGDCLPMRWNPVAIAAGNLNNDSYPDLVVANSGPPPGVSLIFGAQSENFPIGYQSPLKISAKPTKIIISDVDDDGRSDIIIFYKPNYPLTIFYNTKRPQRTNFIIPVKCGVFTPASPVNKGYGHALHPPGPPAGGVVTSTQQVNFLPKRRNWITVGFLNDDRIPDIILTNSEAKTISVLLGTGKRGSPFARSATYVLDGTPAGAPAIGDFNGDKYRDIAIALPAMNDVTIFWGNAKGQLLTKTTFHTGVTPIAVITANLDKDNINDLAVLCQGSAQVWIFTGFLNTSQVPPPVVLAAPGRPGAIVAGDFNGNGQTDLAVADSLGGKIVFYIATSNGNSVVFTPHVKELSVNKNVSSLLAADLNLDSVTDLLVLESRTETGSVFLGMGYVPFIQSPSQVLSCNPNNALLTDLNNDLYPDVVFTDRYSGALLVRNNKGDGTFSPISAVYLAGEDTYSVATGDFDLDKKTDLLVTTATGQLWILWGDGLTGRRPRKVSVK